MKYFKKLVGEKCYLSPINIEDAEKYTEWVNDIEVTKFVYLTKGIINLEKEKEMLKKISNEKNFAIVDLETNNPIGTCGLFGEKPIHRTAEVGIMIGDKEYCNKGYGTDALKLLLDFGFNVLNMHSLHLKVFSDNEKAIKCYEKAGFKYAGKLRESFMIAGKKFDTYLMDILSKEYESVYINKIFE